MPALNVPQSMFLQMPNKFRAFVAGYGSGKTWIGCTAMCAHYWEHPNINQGYFAPTYPQIRDIFYPTLDEVAYGLDLRIEIMEANKEVHFYSGRQYRGTTICRSMERPQTIIGFKIGRALIDEFDVLDPKKADQAWKKIIARLRWQDCANGADVTTTPEGFRTTHKLFVKDVADRPNLANSYGLIQASTRDNAKNLPEGYIESLLDAYPEELISAYIDGQFCNLTTGTVYRGYNRQRCESNETIKPNEPLFVGMDFNIGKMAATIYVQRANGWHAVAELHDVFDTPTMAGLLVEKFERHKITVYPDASGDNASTKNASESDISILRQRGFMIKANPSNPRVRNRILATNKQFEIGRLWVNSRACPTVARCLEQQAYDESGEPDKKTGFDHQCFSGEQEVVANWKTTKFKDIPESGHILCHDGIHRKYTNGGKIKDATIMLCITLSNNDIIRCTPDHKFLTLNGWVMAENIIGETLCDQSLLLKLSRNIKARDIIVAAITSRGTGLGCIEKFGLMHMGRYPRAMLFIISTMTKPITALKTFASYAKESIQRYMAKKKQQCLERLSKQLKSGTQAIMGAAGISSIMKKISTYCTKKLTQFVRNAESNTSPQTPELIGFAQTNAQQQTAESQESTTRKDLALFVATASRSINTKRLLRADTNAVRALVLTIEKESPAYCLTVPDFGMFAVCGFVVANCDASTYPIAYEFPIIRPMQTVKIIGL